MPDALSGPELDAEIARRVFGYVARQRDIHPLYEVPGNRVADYVEVGAEPCPSYPDGRIVGMVYVNGESTLPRYSTDIAAAWEVLQQVRSWERYLKTCFMEALSDAIRARLGRRDQALILDTQSILMNVEPEDICRAALAALEGSE